MGNNMVEVVNICRVLTLVVVLVVVTVVMVIVVVVTESSSMESMVESSSMESMGNMEEGSSRSGSNQWLFLGLEETDLDFTL